MPAAGPGGSGHFVPLFALLALPVRYASIINTGDAAGGAMSLREQLHAYIAQLEQRLRWSALLRGFAILAGGLWSPPWFWS